MTPSPRPNSIVDNLLLYPLLLETRKGDTAALSSPLAPPPNQSTCTSASAIEKAGQQVHPNEAVEQAAQTGPILLATSPAITDGNSPPTDSNGPTSSSLPAFAHETPAVSGHAGEASTDLPTAIPIYESNPAPEYPIVARRRNWEGEVTLRIRVDAEGTVLQAEVERSSGHVVLDRAAVRGVQRWRFEPARRGNVAVESTVLVPIPFILERN